MSANSGSASSGSKLTFDWKEIWKKIYKHSFSQDHLENGPQLFNTENLVLAQRAVRVVETVQKQLIEGTNNIFVKYNGVDMTIRATVINNQVKTINFFQGISGRTGLKSVINVTIETYR